MEATRNNIPIVDLHCHLDLFPDHVELVHECEQKAIRVLSVTTTPRAWPWNRDLNANSRYVRVGLGFHPEIVAERPDEIKLFERYSYEARYIGEIGIDGRPANRHSYELQRKVFERVLDICAEQGGKILTVHSASAVTPVIDSLEKHFPTSRGHVILHWFSGNLSELQRAKKLGCYFSVNPAMLRSKRGRDIVASIPQERMLTESDGPFLTVEGRPARPSDVFIALRELGTLIGKSPEEVSSIVLRNLRKLVS
ncbi:TatD family hydrolase [Candidatus Uhrbacteria bacterium]|nr:TatD family hydrolase [Candidatus Uhrbacteria bacterium]